MNKLKIVIFVLFFLVLMSYSNTTKHEQKNKPSKIETVKVDTTKNIAVKQQVFLKQMTKDQNKMDSIIEMKSKKNYK